MSIFFCTSTVFLTKDSYFPSLAKLWCRRGEVVRWPSTAVFASVKPPKIQEPPQRDEERWYETAGWGFGDPRKKSYESKCASRISEQPVNQEFIKSCNSAKENMWELHGVKGKSGTQS